MHILKVCRPIWSPTPSVAAKNNRAKFHPNTIWNDEALDFLKSLFQQEIEAQQLYIRCGNATRFATKEPACGSFIPQMAPLCTVWTAFGKIVGGQNYERTI